jgi:16S rRNA (adenine1518-N6/adenine1519-N6)-dimethyltransferase
MKLSVMRDLLAQRGIRLTKSLGQNFLHDENQLRRIVAAAELSGGDKVLEIGPGLGPLTEHLLAHAGRVLAIEKDARLVRWLRERFAEPLAASDPPRLELIQADALEFLQQEPRDWRDWKLVANLPYSVASPILVTLACGFRAPQKMVATLQLEVARRLLARPGQADYGVLTLLVQRDFIPRMPFKIPRGCFFPEPAVDSACVVLDRRTPPLLQENFRAAFVKIVKRAFSQRRKVMGKLLQEDWPEEKLSRALAGLNLPPQTRAEQLSLEQFLALTQRLAT